jgi:hypothetical protein
MTPQEKINWLIMVTAMCMKGNLPNPPPYPELPNIDIPSDYLQDAKEQVRSGGVETGIAEHRYFRHYERREVAAKLPDGTWVGWPYWYGGGKHGCPEEID